MVTVNAKATESQALPLSDDNHFPKITPDNEETVPPPIHLQSPLPYQMLAVFLQAVADLIRLTTPQSLRPDIEKGISDIITNFSKTIQNPPKTSYAQKISSPPNSVPASTVNKPSGKQQHTPTQSSSALDNIPAESHQDTPRKTSASSQDTPAKSYQDTPRKTSGSSHNIPATSSVKRPPPNQSPQNSLAKKVLKQDTQPDSQCTQTDL